MLIKNLSTMQKIIIPVINYVIITCLIKLLHHYKNKKFNIVI